MKDRETRLYLLTQELCDEAYRQSMSVVADRRNPVFWGYLAERMGFISGTEDTSWISVKPRSGDTPQLVEGRFWATPQDDTPDRLQCFIYILLRDHLTAGVINEVLRDHVDRSAQRTYSDKALAEYAKTVAERIRAQKIAPTTAEGSQNA